MSLYRQLAESKWHPINPDVQRGTSFAGERNDCTVHATAIAAQIPYYEAHKLLAKFGRKARKGLNYGAFATQLDQAIGGYRVSWVTMPSCLPLNRTRPSFSMFAQYVTLSTFLRDFPKGRFVCRKAGHVFAVIDGKVYDASPISLRTKITGIYHFEKVN